MSHDSNTLFRYTQRWAGLSGTNVEQDTTFQLEERDRDLEHFLATNLPLKGSDRSIPFNNNGTWATDDHFTWDNTDETLILGNLVATAHFTAVPWSLHVNGPVVFRNGWSTSDTDIDGLIPGTSFGTLLAGQASGHFTIALQEDNTSDGFYIISGGGDWSTDNTWDTIMFGADALGRTGINTIPSTSRQLLVKSTLAVAAEFRAEVKVDTAGVIALILKMGTDATTVGANDDFLRLLKGDNTQIGTVSGDGAGGVAYNTTSDDRLKTNARPVNSDIFNKVGWMTYEMSGKTRHGLLAQELNIVPELTHLVTEGDDNFPWMVNYTGLIPIIGAKVSELDERITALEKSHGRP